MHLNEDKANESRSTALAARCQEWKVSCSFVLVNSFTFTSHCSQQPLQIVRTRKHTPKYFSSHYTSELNNRWILTMEHDIHSPNFTSSYYHKGSNYHVRRRRSTLIKGLSECNWTKQDDQLGKSSWGKLATRVYYWLNLQPRGQCLSTRVGRIMLQI